MRLPAGVAGSSLLVQARQNRGPGARPLRRPRATPATSAFPLAIPAPSVGHLSWGSFRTPSPTPGANPGAGTLPHSSANRAQGGVLVHDSRLTVRWRAHDWLVRLDDVQPPLLAE